MKPRITINTTKDGELEIWLNPSGRDLLVRELLALNDKSEHFHFNPDEVPLSSRAYRTSDSIIEYGKVYFRTDDWDREYFPHVFQEKD